MSTFGRQSQRSRQPLPRGFTAIWSTVALDLVGFGIILPVLPLYARKFHATPGLIGLLVASFSVAQLLCSPLWGRLSDRIGRKPVLIVSLLGTAVGSLLTGLAGGLVLLFLGRLVDGGSGASVSVAQASVADLAAPKERARLLGLLGAAFGLGFVLGPALGGLLSLVSPRLPFFVAAALAGGNAIVALRRLPETHHHATREATSRSRHLLSQRGVAGLLAVAFLSLVSFSAFEATFSLFGNRRLGLNLSSTYALFTVIGVMIAADQVVLVRRAVDRWGERGALQAGLVLNAGGLALLVGVRSLGALVPSLVLLTTGQGLITPTLTSAVVGQAPAGERGRLLGVQQSVGGLARVVGPVIGGVAFGRLGVWVPYAGGAALLLGASALLAGVPRIVERPVTA